MREELPSGILQITCDSRGQLRHNQEVAAGDVVVERVERECVFAVQQKIGELKWID